MDLVDKENDFALKDYENECLNGKFYYAYNIPGLQYYLAISPTGVNEKDRGETWVYLNVNGSNERKISAEFTLSVESANFSNNSNYVYDYKHGHGAVLCKTEEFFDSKSEYFVDGEITINVKIMFKSGFLLFGFALFAIVFADPNEEFAECCKGKSVPDSCIKYCTYDFTPPPALKFFRKKPKSSDGDECYADDVMTSVMQCSQKDKDNTECCKTAGVGNEHDFCLELCDGTKPITNDEKYAECEDVANKVKECEKNA